MNLNVKDTFNTELPADPILENTRRQVVQACYSFATPKSTSKPSIIHSSSELALDLGLNQDDLKSAEFQNIFTGNSVLPDTHPYAMCYGGHQFGNWAGQLGDGKSY